MTEVIEKRGKGRPSSFNEALAERILAMAKEGLTDEQMAKAICVTKQTFNNWKAKHPDFFDSLKESKEVADELVEVSLYRRACGYFHEEVKTFLVDGVVVEHLVTKHYAPDVTAAIFWLKNRQPAKWRDVSAVVHSSTKEVDAEIDKEPKENVLSLLRDLRGPKTGT